MFRYSSSGDGFYLKKDSIRHNIYARHKLPNYQTTVFQVYPVGIPGAKFQRGLHCHVPFHTRLAGRSRLSGGNDISWQETLDIVK